MPGNYGLNGNDWYNQRLNQIASMMSMQNTDPAYMAGALISRYFLKPQIQNFMQDKFLGNGGDDSGSNGTQFQQTNGKYEAVPTANGMASTGNATTDAAIAAFSPDNGVRQGINAGMPYTQAELLSPIQGYDYSGAMNAAREDMDLARFAQEKSQQNQPAPAQPPQPPTQADMTEATNNDVNQAVTREAQAQSGGILSPLAGLGAQSIANQAAANVYGVPSFQQGSPLGNGGEPETVAGASSGIGDDVLRRALLGRALQAKQDYAVAQQNNDEQGMKQAHDAAEAVRQMAKEYGVEIPEAGADVTIDELANAMLIEGEKQAREAQQKMAEQIRNMTPQELLKQPDITVSPNDFYQRAYQDAISKRIPEDMARQLASDASAQYEARYMNELQNTMMIQGVSDNAITNAGAALLANAVLANNPQFAQLYSSMYASPRDNYAFNQALQKAAIQQQYNQANIDLKNRQAIDMLAKKTANQKELEAYKVALNTEKEDYMARLNSQLAGVREEQKGQIRAQMLQKLKNAGYTFTPEEERNYILSGSVGRGSKNSTSSDDKTPTWAKGLNEQISKAQRTLDGDDIDKLKDKIAANASEMTQDQLDFYNSVVLALLFKRAKDAGYEDEAAGYYQGIPDYLREQLLPGY